MFSQKEFVRHSLELHLFFGRIMKEHSFFLQIGFTPRNSNFIQQADMFRRELDKVLWEVVSISNGVISPEVLHSGEVFTQYTINAEMASSFFTGVQIPYELTKAEMNLSASDNFTANQMLEQKVYEINERVIELVEALIRFKAAVLSNVLACKMFTMNYPLLIDHIMREAKLYVKMVKYLQGDEKIDLRKEALEQEMFWNRIMAEHAKFIRGLLDPTEEDLIMKAENFGEEFDELAEEAKAAMDNTMPSSQVTMDSLQATRQIRDFKMAGTEGILNCQIKSIIIPLLGDHTIREANHFLRLLKSYEK